MGSDQLRLAELCAALSSHLADNPSDLRHLNGAIAAGLDQAMDNMRQKIGRSDIAMLSALSLADGKRIPAEIKQVFYSKIADAIGPNASPVEKRFLARATEAHSREEG